jgi:hypothetical protein
MIYSVQQAVYPHHAVIYKLNTFIVYGSVHRKYIPIYIQQDATLHSLFYLETSLHVSGGTTTNHQERIQLSTASGICPTVTATCHYRGRVGTD